MAVQIDFAFARLEGELGERIRSQALRKDKLVLALPESHPLCKNKTISLDKLAEEDFVMFHRHLSPMYFDSLLNACQSAKFSPRIVHWVRSIVSQVAAVGCGQGIALVPSTIRKIAPTNVLFRPLKEKIDVVTISFAWDSTKTNRFLPLMLNDLARL